MPMVVSPIASIYRGKWLLLNTSLQTLTIDTRWTKDGVSIGGLFAVCASLTFAMGTE